MKRANKTIIITMIIAMFIGFGMGVQTEDSFAAVKTPAKVKGVSVASKSCVKITLKWKKVKGADGYQVMRKAASGKTYKSVYKGTKRSFTNKTKLSAYTKYTFKVRAYKKWTKNGRTKYRYGKYSTVKVARTAKHTYSKVTKAATFTTAGTQTRTCTVCGKKETTQTSPAGRDAELNVQVKTVRTEADKYVNVLSWNKAAGASGYEIERSEAGGAFTQVYYSKNAGYSDMNVIPGTGYAYRVTAYSGTTGGSAFAKNSYQKSITADQNASVASVPANSAAAKAVLKTPASFTATASYTTVTLKWAAVDGARSYNIYRNGQLIKTVTTTSYKDSGLAPLTDYSYSVEAVRGDFVSAKATASVTTGRPAPPTVKVTVTDTTATISWDAVPGAEGYRIYDQDQYMLNDTMETSYTAEGLSAGTAYTYYVATKQAGKYSEKIQAKVKTASGNYVPPAKEHGFIIDTNVTFKYNGTNSFYLGQAWTTSLNTKIQAAYSGYEKVTRPAFAETSEFIDEATGEITPFGPFDETVYMYGINGYNRYLMVYVADGKICGWQASGWYFGTFYGRDIVKGDDIREYGQIKKYEMLGYSLAYKTNVGAMVTPFADIDEGDTIVGGFKTSVGVNSFAQNNNRTAYIAAERRIGLHVLNAFRVTAGRSPLIYSEYLDGEGKTWSGTVFTNGANRTYSNRTYGAQPMAETVYANEGSGIPLTHDATQYPKGPLAGFNTQERATVTAMAFMEATGLTGQIGMTENLGNGGVGEGCVAAYLDSNMHLATLLYPDSKYVGIGIIPGRWHCEEFMDKIGGWDK